MAAVPFGPFRHLLEPGDDALGSQDALWDALDGPPRTPPRHRDPGRRDRRRAPSRRALGRVRSPPRDVGIDLRRAHGARRHRRPRSTHRDVEGRPGRAARPGRARSERRRRDPAQRTRRRRRTADGAGALVAQRGQRAAAPRTHAQRARRRNAHGTGRILELARPRARERAVCAKSSRLASAGCRHRNDPRSNTLRSADHSRARRCACSPTTS